MRGAWRRVVTVCAVVGLCGSLATGAAGSSASHRADREAPARSTASDQAPDGGKSAQRARAANPGIPPLKYDPLGNLSAWGIQTRPTVATSTKAKVSVRLGITNFLAYLNFCIASPDYNIDSCCLKPSTSDCHKVPFPAYRSSQPGVYWVEQFGSVWAASPPGSPAPFGVLPPVRVHALAFGSLPVTATVQVRQVVGVRGMVEPLKYYTLTGASFFEGDYVAGFGVAPLNQTATDASFAYFPGEITGRVEIQLSDVTVDGRTLDVGDECRTARPGALSLISAKGYAPGVDPSQLRGRPGAFSTIANSTIQGNLQIPAFRGCRSGAENLDPLITAFVSAGHNPVETRINNTINKCGDPAVFCPPYPREQPPVQPNTREARTETVTPGQARSGLALALAKLPDAKRRQLVNLLPASTLKGLPPGLVAR